MRLRKWEPTDPAHARWVRDVCAILDRGFSWADQVGPLLAFRWSHAALDVAAETQRRPLGVWCVAATKIDDPSSTESGCRVRWTWRDGQLRIHEIDTTSTAAAYDVTLGLVTE